MRKFFLICFSLTVILSLPLHPNGCASSAVPLSDDELLDLIQQYSFRYFVNERGDKTGLIYDQAENFSSSANHSLASIAATGFGLTAYAVGVERGWLAKTKAEKFTQQILMTLLHRTPNEHGFFYHFLNAESAKRGARSELSPIDTALLLAGVLFAAEYYENPQIREMATEIYERVDWPWMLNGGKTFALAWTPERGFDARRWDHYSELLIMYLLAIGSPTHPVSEETWHAFRRQTGSYQNYRMVYLPPLFVHQYSHIWVDFRDKHDDYMDYFDNSVQASLANRAFAIEMSPRFRSYGANSWGLTASDGPSGYRAYGAPPGFAYHDGTVAPTGCGSSIVFTPDESLTCLRHYYENMKKQLWGRYGFSDAFNLDKNWVSPRVLGIDQGALLLMIENYRSGLIWDKMNQNPHLRRAMEKTNFQPGTKELEWPQPPEFRAAYIPGGIQIDSYLKDWPNGESLLLNASNIESGEVKDDKDLKARVRFAWDEKMLYFYADITDDSVISRYRNGQIFRQDAVEFFIDPENNGLKWDHPSDFQIGMSPSEAESGVLTWAWFGVNGDPGNTDDVVVRGFTHGSGYVLEGGIRWRFLGIQPFQGKKIRLSFSVHDLDEDRSEAKLQWFFRPEGDFEEFGLASIYLD